MINTCTHTYTHMHIHWFVLNSYAKTILNKIIRWVKEKRRGPAEEDDVLTRWEEDYEMIPIDAHGMFFEYLELGILKMSLY